MALDPNENLNALFNKASYSTMFLDTNAAGQIVYTNIAAGGALKTYKSIALTGEIANNNNVLNSSGASSEYRINRFLNGKKLREIALNTGSPAVYKSLIEDYVIPKVPSDTYNTSGNSSPLTSANIGTIITDLKDAKLLLKTTDIYNSADTTGNSLIKLKQLQQQTGFLETQQTILTELENRNLKFFSAFLVEYWFYSCRYRILLKEFFNIYTSASASATHTKNELALTSATNSQYLNKLAEFLAQLNMRMSDMIRIVNAINSDYSTMITSIKATLNNGTGAPGSNAALTSTITLLENSYIESDEYLSNKDFSKEVMEYNSEKNRHSNILLGLYAFLNIAALATVFHLASN